MILKITGVAARVAAQMAVHDCPEGWVMRLTEATRSLDQNAKLWPMLEDVAKQVEWHGYRLTTWEWKDVFTAALKRSRVVPGLDGGFVVCGQHTSNMTKGEFSELIELMYSFGAEQGVVWSDPVERAA